PMIPRLSLNHLNLLVALADTGSVTAAAGRLGITQSAVSHRLREAERRVGLPLTLRGEQGLVLTPEGERLRAFGERFIKELVRLEQEMRAAGGGGRALLRLGQATYSRYHWLPAFLDYLADCEPTLSIDLSGRATARPFASLLEGSVDVSTVYGRPSALPRFRWRKLGSDPLVAVMAPGHRLASESFLDSTNMGDERFYTYPAGFGVGIFSRWAVAPELSDGTLLARPVGPEGMVLDWWAVSRARDPKDGPAERLADALVHWGGRVERPLSTLGFEGAKR
ncbi:MAG: LysR family transcriptional regulator, partial [Limibacillus sp.]